MVAILVLALVVLWLVLPIITLVKVSGIASEMWELKMLVKRLANSDAKPKDKPEAEVKPEIVAKPEAEAQPKIVAKPKVPAPKPLVPPHVPVAETPSQRRQPAPEPEPTAFDIFWSRIEDWLAVRGAFAPVGMTREFAVATRWLVRIGTLILVGAIAYFMVLAIDKGWIGPAQRVYGMMFWGVFGIVAGTWIKFRKENYAILGEVAAALGLVALYLSWRPLYWIPVALAGIFCLCKMEVIVSHHFAWRGAWALNHLGWAMVFAALAFVSRRRAWGGTPVFIVFSCVCAALALGTASLEWWHVNDATAILLFCLFAALLAELGARSEERTLQVLAVMATVVMSFVGFGRFAASAGIGSGGYAHDLVDRIQYLWPAPAVVAFVGWRLGGRALWAGWLRNWSLGIAAVMSFVVVTGESHFFGREFLPMLRGGFVTIVWAAVGVLLIAGAFLYLKFRNRFEEAGAEARHPDQIAGAEARRPSTEVR